MALYDDNPETLAQKKDRERDRDDYDDDSNNLSEVDRLLSRYRERFVHTSVAVKEWLRCVRCRQRYRECDNMGTWKCRYHPGVPYQGTYSCCRSRDGEIAYDNGCMRCDHSQDAYQVRERRVARVPTFASVWYTTIPSHAEAPDYVVGSVQDIRDTRDVSANQRAETHYQRLVQARHINVDRTDHFRKQSPIGAS